MAETIIVAALLLVAVLFVIAIIVNGCNLIAQKIRHTDHVCTVARMKKNATLLGLFCLFGFGVVFVSNFTTATPAIRDESGKKIEGSIAELRPITLNGRKEWISIRGHKKDNPILLFLAGGPGGSQMAAVRHELSALEKHFIVVNWDQPGSGKSYSAANTHSLTVETYIEDGYALTKYLCENFNQEKIYLVGESWGSALGIFLIDKAPELYHAFVGTGQMVAFVETEIIDYNLALELARESEDKEKVAKLEANGPPPYYGPDITWKSAEYLNYLGSHMTRNPAIHNSGYNTLRDLFSREYSIPDKINYIRGIVDTFNNIYPQLYGIDLRTDYTHLDVPVYFFIGRHDINAPISLAESYFDALHTPDKKIIWFEHSGHSPWINESSLFVEKLLAIP